jgi:hypothetical protein
MKSGVHLTSQTVCGFSTITLLPRFEYLVLQQTQKISDSVLLVAVPYFLNKELLNAYGLKKG